MHYEWSVYLSEGKWEDQGYLVGPEEKAEELDPEVSHEVAGDGDDIPEQELAEEAAEVAEAEWTEMPLDQPK